MVFANSGRFGVAWVFVRWQRSLGKTSFTILASRARPVSNFITVVHTQPYFIHRKYNYISISSTLMERLCVLVITENHERRGDFIHPSPHPHLHTSPPPYTHTHTHTHPPHPPTHHTTPTSTPTRTPTSTPTHTHPLPPTHPSPPPTHTRHSASRASTTTTQHNTTQPNTHQPPTRMLCVSPSNVEQMKEAITRSSRQLVT